MLNVLKIAVRNLARFGRRTLLTSSLITLGISGGLVPCPDAIAILLVAIAINRIFLGLALIISFSLGLAIVLITIGLLMVSSSRLFKRMDAFNKFAPLMPVNTAVISFSSLKAQVMRVPICDMTSASI